MLLCPRAPQGPVWYCITKTIDTHITQEITRNLGVLCQNLGGEVNIYCWSLGWTIPNFAKVAC